MTERQAKILALVNEAESIEVAALAEKLRVSRVTVRKDLTALEERRLLQRQHGYAMRMSPDDIGYRMTFAYEVKKRIAAKAAQLVGAGETIMIESGSTCAMLAVELAERKHDITIITNSVYITEAVRVLPGAKTILLGGAYDSGSQVTTGPLIPLCAEKFYVDKFFIGTDGFDPAQGFFSNADMMRAEAVNAMAKCANKKIILADSGKFNQRGVVKLFYPSDLAAVITDGVPENCRALMLEGGMEIILA